MVFGLALVLALLFGVASIALAGTGANGVFNLGVKNTVNVVTQLVSSAGAGPAGPMLSVDNNSSATGATGLEILTEAGKPPMMVNRTTRVTNLNADRLDGKDSSQLLSKDTYTNAVETTGLENSGIRFFTVSCDEGDKLLSGGFRDVDAGTTLVSSFAGGLGSDPHWTLEWRNDATADTILMFAYCSDFAPAHS
jgi:hypothetical protein